MLLLAMMSANTQAMAQTLFARSSLQGCLSLTGVRADNQHPWGHRQTASIASCVLTTRPALASNPTRQLRLST